MFKPLLIAVVLAVIATPVFADDDLEAGEKVFAKCKTCHLIGDATGKRAGPSLNDVMGRTAGTLDGFKYSDAMSAKGAEGLVWTPETLADYLKKPKDYVPGTKMAFAGLAKAEDIENLTAFLLSHSPDYQTE